MKTKCITSPKANKIKKIQAVSNELISIILLCDLPGYRMKSYGPLSLINIDNIKLIDHQIQAIENVFKNFEIILCVGFDAEKICKYVRNKYSHYNIRIVENQLFNSSNSCESVRISLNNTLNTRILICDGNLLLSKNSLFLIDTTESCALIENDPCVNLEIGINVNENNEAQYFSFGAYKTWSEILYLHNEDIIESLRKVLSFPENKNKFIFEAINEILKNKYKIKCINNNFFIKKISNIKTYHSMKGEK